MKETFPPGQPAKPGQSIQSVQPAIQAICHDYRTILSGTLENICAWGCELKCHASTPSPAFPAKAKIVLNLFEAATGRSLSMNAQLSRIERRDGAWIYRIRWSELPELLAG